MAASVVPRRTPWSEAGHPEAANAAELADLFCRSSRRKVVRLFHELWANDDVRKYKVALRVLDGKHAWLERGRADAARSARQAADEAGWRSSLPAPIRRRCRRCGRSARTKPLLG